jgi:hypothetical protein
MAAFGGTHGNEWEGQVAVKRLCRQLDPHEIWAGHSDAAIEPKRMRRQSESLPARSCEHEPRISRQSPRDNLV